jgi:arginyl-tRNA synthetase
MRWQSLRRAARCIRKDGALWFRASQYGDDEDRVLVRANGQKTYFAPDIAYHLQKRERGFERLIDVLGADHHGYVARVRGALVAMGQPGDEPGSLPDAVRQPVSRRGRRSRWASARRSSSRCASCARRSATTPAGSST